MTLANKKAKKRAVTFQKLPFDRKQSMKIYKGNIYLIQI